MNRNRWTDALRRGRQYYESYGWRAFLRRSLRPSLWLPRLVSRPPSPNLPSPPLRAVMPPSSSGQISDFPLEAEADLLDLVLRRLGRIEERLNQVQQNQIVLEQLASAAAEEVKSWSEPMRAISGKPTLETGE